MLGDRSAVSITQIEQVKPLPPFAARLEKGLLQFFLVAADPIKGVTLSRCYASRTEALQSSSPLAAPMAAVGQ